MFTFIKPYVWIVESLVMLALVIGLFVAGWHYGAKHVQTRWDAATAKENLIVAQANAKTLAIQQQDAQASKDISARYESQLANMRLQNAKKNSVAYGIVCRDRVRINPASASVMPEVTATASSVNAISSNNVASNQVNALPEDCAITTQQLVDLQSSSRGFCFKGCGISQLYFSTSKIHVCKSTNC